MKYISILILFYCCPVYSSAAQADQIDSLKQLLKTNKYTGTRVDILNNLSLLLPGEDHYLSEAISLSSEIGYDAGLADAYTTLSSRLVSNTASYDSALKLSLYALEFIKNQELSDKHVSIYSTLGLIYDYKGEYEKAIGYFIDGLKASEALNNEMYMSQFYNRIGIVYNYQGSYDKSLEYFYKSLEIYKRTGNAEGQADVYNNIGIIYRKKGNIDKAIVHYTSSLNIKKEIGNMSSIASAYNNLGAAYFYKHDYHKALEFYQQSLALKHEGSSLKDLAPTYINIGESYAHIQAYDQALSHINKGIALAHETGNIDDLRIGYEELSQVYALMQDYQNAYRYNLIHNKLKDSLFDIERGIRIAELQTKYDVEKKEQKILLLEKENKIKQIEASNSYLLRNIFILAFIAITFLVVIIVMNYRKDLLKTKHLNVTQNKISAQNKILKAMSYEKDQLMKIVAHDLRSPLNQIEGLINIVNFNSENLNDEQNQALSNVKIATNHSKQLIKKILATKSIDPGELKVSMEIADIEKLLIACVKIQQMVANTKNIKIHLEVNTKDTKIAIDINYAEQIIENLLSNAIKFSPYDKNIYIRLNSTDETIIIQIEDEGPGFTDEDMKKIFGVYEKLSASPTGGETSIGLGLSIVKKYVGALDGRVWCESTYGQGATFFVELKKEVV